MNVSAIGNHTAASAAAALEYAGAGALPTHAPKTGAPTAAEIKKAASQFEAIIMRQLLSPAIEPLMSGGLGGSSDSGGGGVYGYMMTDVLAENLSKGGGMGLAEMLEKQLSPRSAKGEITSSAALKHSTLPSTP
jgi:peptidoglycan hydrolase FlgJ